MQIGKALVALLVTPVVVLGILLSPIILLAVVIYAFITIDSEELKKTLGSSEDDSEGS